MNNLRKFYEEAEKNEEIKKVLIAANEKASGLSFEEVKQEIIKLAAQFGYEVSEKDFDDPDGELTEDEMENVVGGFFIKTGCFIVDADCTVYGFVNNKGACIILGLMVR